MKMRMIKTVRSYFVFVILFLSFSLIFINFAENIYCCSSLSDLFSLSFICNLSIILSFSSLSRAIRMKPTKAFRERETGGTEFIDYSVQSISIFQEPLKLVSVDELSLNLISIVVNNYHFYYNIDLSSIIYYCLSPIHYLLCVVIYYRLVFNTYYLSLFLFINIYHLVLLPSFIIII